MKPEERIGEAATNGPTRSPGKPAPDEPLRMHFPMEEFFGEQIEVVKAKTSPRPLRFKWHGEVHDVVEVLHERVDTGFDGLPPRSRKWYTRRHRRYYVVRDSKGDVFEIYLDYSNRRRLSWWLVTKYDRKRAVPFAEQPTGEDNRENH